MTAIGATASPTPRPAAAPRWPLVAAPFVGLVYYLVLLIAFRLAIGDVVNDTSDLADMTGLTWGKHWIYHTFAQAVSVSFGTFIAGGLARERAAIAGLIGGFGISLWWTAWIAIVLYVSQYVTDKVIVEPSYQYVIAALAAVAAPIVGYSLGEATKEISTEQPGGFSGIPRAHFLWLWFPAYWYAAAIIGPFLKYALAYWLGYDGRSVMALSGSGILTGIFYFALCVLPVVAFSVPLFVGLGLMSGHIGNSSYGSKSMRPAVRQALGPIVLVVGWFIAAWVQYGVILTAGWFGSLIS